MNTSKILARIIDELVKAKAGLEEQYETTGSHRNRRVHTLTPFFSTNTTRYSQKRKSIKKHQFWCRTGRGEYQPYRKSRTSHLFPQFSYWTNILIVGVGWGITMKLSSGHSKNSLQLKEENKKPSPVLEAEIHTRFNIITREGSGELPHSQLYLGEICQDNRKCSIWLSSTTKKRIK